MVISQDHIKNCIKTAQEADRLFSLHTRQNGDFDRSIDDFRNFMATYGTVNVYQHKISYEGEPIKGAMIAYDDKYDIVLLNGLDPYWKRFVEFKELFHVILDIDDNEKVFRNSDYLKQVESTLASFPDMKNKSENFVANEKLAEIAAMEFLVPYSRRSQINTSIKDGTMTLEQVSNMYKLPEEVIDLYLSESYMENILPCLP